MASMAGWPKAIVFDLDGTLADSVIDITHALNIGLAEAGLAPCSAESVKTMVGGGARLLAERAVARAGASGEDATAQVLERFLAAYRARPCSETQLYPGARDLLRDLKASGVLLGLCTNKPDDITSDILAALGVRDYFAAIVGGAPGLPKKPRPAMLLLTFERLGVAPRDGVMLGDSAADVGAARGAGCPVLAISHGYGDRPALELGADGVVEALSDVPAAVRGLVPIAARRPLA